MKPTSSYNSNNFQSSKPTDTTPTTYQDVKMVDTNLNLNLIGLLTSDGDINNWRNMHQCLQAEGYSNQLKDSEYHNHIDSF